MYLFSNLTQETKMEIQNIADFSCLMDIYSGF